MTDFLAKKTEGLTNVEKIYSDRERQAIAKCVWDVAARFENGTDAERVQSMARLVHEVIGPFASRADRVVIASSGNARELDAKQIALLYMMDYVAVGITNMQVEDVAAVINAKLKIKDRDTNFKNLVLNPDVMDKCMQYAASFLHGKETNAGDALYNVMPFNEFCINGLYLILVHFKETGFPSLSQYNLSYPKARAKVEELVLALVGKEIPPSKILDTFFYSPEEPNAQRIMRSAQINREARLALNSLLQESGVYDVLKEVKVSLPPDPGK